MATAAFDILRASPSEICRHNAKAYEETAAGCRTETGRKSILALAAREYGAAKSFEARGL